MNTGIAANPLLQTLLATVRLMSQENVEIARRSMDAFNRGDRTVWLAMRHEESEIVPLSTWPGAQTIHGRAACWDFYRDIGDTLSLQVSYLGSVDAGADKVLTHQRQEGRGQASGVNVHDNFWIVITFRDARVLRDEWFTDRAKALEAAGLSG